MPDAPTAESAWQRQSVWSQTADKLRAGPSRIRSSRLALTGAAAAMALAGSQVKPVSFPASVLLTVLAALALACTGLLRGRTSAEQARKWTRARSVSEALKTEVCLYLCRAGRYEGEDNEQLLDAQVQRIEADAGDLQRYTDGVQPRQRPLPDIRDGSSYMENRVLRSQLTGYYEPKARKLRQQLRVMKVAEISLALCAAVLAALTSVSSSVGAWAAVVTTASGAVAAYIAAERYEFLWIEYSRTASELRRLYERRTGADGRPLSDSELAVECENVISVQNQAWMAKWGPENDSENASATGFLWPGLPSRRGGGRECGGGGIIRSGK